MARGRKPKADAQRRGGATPVQAVVLAAETAGTGMVERKPVEKPAYMGGNELMSECWDALVGASPNFEQCDVPLLESYCFWYSVLRQAMANTLTDEGVITLVGKVDDEGYAIPGTASPNPDLRNAEKATQMLRQLGDALNLSPTARDRAGLMRAMTKSTQADVVKKTLDGYEQFKQQQKALNAKK